MNSMVFFIVSFKFALASNIIVGPVGGSLLLVWLFLNKTIMACAFENEVTNKKKKKKKKQKKKKKVVLLPCQYDRHPMCIYYFACHFYFLKKETSWPYFSSLSADILDVDQ
jgi:hypothetical protein